MSFAYKKLKPSDFSSTPYVANKLYDIPSSSYDDLGVKIYVGEYIPINNLDFDPINDNKDIDGNYRRLIFDSVVHLYYSNYVTESSAQNPYPANTNQFWHSSSYDNYSQNTLASGSFDATIRKIPYFTSSFTNYDTSGSSIYDLTTYFAENNAKIRVVTIPQNIFGNGLQPHTFELSGSGYIIRDDGLGNLFDYSDFEDDYASAKYSDPEATYYNSGSKVYVGNIFYSHGVAVISNEDYFCFSATNPVARNDYITVTNTQRNKTIALLDSDFDDCSGIDTGSITLHNDPNSSFPDTSISAQGDLIITPNLSGSQPGNYKINYTVNNTSGLPSNTASIDLTLTTLPLSSSIVNLTQSCFGSNNSASVTFSFDQGVPPYSYSLNVDGFSDFRALSTSSNDLYQPVVSASILPTRSLVLTVKDAESTLYTQSINTSLPSINRNVYPSPVSFNDTNDGKIIISSDGSNGAISASLSSSFSSSRITPANTSSFDITVVSHSEGNRYHINGTKTGSINLRRGISSSLIQINSSNDGHPIRLSTTPNGTHGGGVAYTGSNNGVTYNGTAGTDGELSITLPDDAPDVLYYYCINHSNMGGQVNVYDSTSTLGIPLIEFGDLVTGSYQVFFKDSNGCTDTSSVVIDKIQPVTASYTVNNASAFSASDGSFIQRRDLPIEGGRLPLTWSWSGSTGFTTNSVDAVNAPSGTYTLDVFDANSATYSFDFDLLSPTILTYTASIDYSSSLSSSIKITNLGGGVNPYNITASTLQSNYFLTASSGNSTIELDAAQLSSGSASIFIQDATSASLFSASIENINLSGSNSSSAIIGTSASLEYYARRWEISQSFCENTTGSNLPSKRTLNFYSYTGSAFVKVLVRSGSETPVEFVTSGSATGSFAWTNNDTIYIDIQTGSSHAFSVRREYSGSGDVSGTIANVTGSEITNSAIITGSLRLDDFADNRDVSLPFGLNYSTPTAHITASKVNFELVPTTINFKFDKQIQLAKIRDNFTGSATLLSTTGSNNSGSNFIARNDEFINEIYGNTGSYFGPNRDLFRDNYPFGNIMNTNLGTNILYTNGKIFSGSVSASALGTQDSNDVYYVTQRADKMFMAAFDVDSVDFFEASSFTSASFFDSDPLSPRTNLNPVTYKNHTIYAGSQAMENDLMYVMITREDEDVNMNLPSGLGGGEIFSRRLQLTKDINRIYYLFSSPEVGPSFINNHTSSFNVTVEAYTEGNRYNIDGVKTGSIILRRGVSASLVQSDASNDGHPIRLSVTPNGTHGGGVAYTGSNNGISYKGTAGSSGELSINLPADAPSTLYYYCINHSNMGGQINVFNSSSVIQEDVDNRAIAIGKFFIDNVIDNYA